MDYPICYLILCHNNPKNIKELIEALCADDAYFVIHIDKKSQDDFSFLSTLPNVYLVHNRVSITWGDITVIDAVLNLARSAIESFPFAHHYCLLSGADFPVKSHRYIKNYLKRNGNKDYIEGIAFPSTETQWIEGGRRRLEAYVLPINSHSNATIEPRRFSLENLRQLCKVLLLNTKRVSKAIDIWKSYPTRKFPFEFQPYAGEMWWMLSNETLKNVLSWNHQNPEYYEYHLNSQVPDEMYINTIVWNISKCVCGDIKRYISWVKKTDQSPCWMTYDKDFGVIDNSIKNPDILFIRKIKDEKLIDYIKSQIQDVKDEVQK